MTDSVVLVCKLVPPGAATLPTPLQLAAGDTLHTSVQLDGVDEDGNRVLTTHWEADMMAEMSVTIEFDYMEVKSASGRGRIFVELERGRDRG
jgi:hypothetical protein